MQDDEISANPPQVSGSGREPHLAFQFCAKLRDKLENLAHWRIDPSLIEFPKDAHGFRGGNATVSRAFLASPPSLGGCTNESNLTTDERSDSDVQNPGLESFSDPRQFEHEKEREDKDEGRKSSGQASSQKVVAVKKLKLENDPDLERVLGLALRESEFVLELSHPNIVGFEGFVEDAPKNIIWLVFPWQENGNLRDFLASGEWEIPERISLIYDVAEGVKYLHSQVPPIYHGDLKSLNVLVNSDYYAIITDFGSARRLRMTDPDQKPKRHDPQPRPEPPADEESLTLQAVYSASTNTITLTGNKYTLRWAAPELLRDDPPSLACDIWALGWIAYEVMTNTIPFHDVRRDVAVVNRVIQGNLPSITNHARMSLIQALCSLMAQCWSIIPEKRPTAANCVKLIVWMPKIVPVPTQAGNPEASQTRYAGLLFQLGEMYKGQSDYVSASDCFTKALNIYAIAEDTDGKAQASWGLAEIHRFRSEYSKAAGLYSDALQLYSGTGDHENRALALCGLAEVQRAQGELTEASTSYSEALQLYTDIGSQTGRSDTLWGLAEIHRLKEEYNEAIKLYSESLQIRTDVGFSLGRASVLWSLGEVHRSRGEYSEAIKFYSESLQIYTEMGDRAGQVEALCGLADTHLYRGAYDDAASFYSRCLQIATDIGDKDWGAEALFGLAKTHDRQGHRSEAISFYTEASGAFREIGHSRKEAEAVKKAADLRTEEAA